MLRRSLDGVSSLNFPDTCGGADVERGYMTVSCQVLSMTQLLPAIANQHVPAVHRALQPGEPRSLTRIGGTRMATVRLSCSIAETQDRNNAMAKFGIGQAVRRVEDQRFLTGQGRYVDDMMLPAMTYGVIVLSPHAHARIKHVDVSKAKAAPGVLLVLTGADVELEKLASMTAHLMPEDFGAPKGHRTFQPLLCKDRVRCVGDRVAFVVAETHAQARDAAERILIDYEPQPVVVNIEDAAREGAPKVWDDNPNGNVAFRLMFGNQQATDQAFAKAKHVVKLRVENNRLSPASMEPRVAIGDYSLVDDFYTLYTASQNPHGVRTEMSHIFHVPENRIRVVAPDVGGGFGLKGSSFPDDALVLWGSRKLRRPVKWVATRSESMLTDHHGREMDLLR